MIDRRYKKASSRIVKRRKLRGYLSLLIRLSFPFAILILSLFFLKSDFIQIKSFEILGAETISSQDVETYAKDFVSGNRFILIPKTNILFLNKEKLATALLSQFSRLEKVDVDKNFFSKKIELNLVERKSDFLWCSFSGECFSMNKNGLVFEKEEKNADKLIFQGIIEGNPLMKNFASAVKIQNYLKFVDILKNAGFETILIKIESADKAIAKTDIGEIIFNPSDENLSEIAQNIILLIDETKNKVPAAEFQYIDARFGNKMFYKLY